MPLALCSEEGGAPDWVQLTPKGPRLPSRDGREWQLPDPDAVVRAYTASVAAGIEAPVDFEHATHIKGEVGERADAVGWVREIANRDGALWGRIDWTDTGRAAVVSRGYRYLSPGFFFNPATRVIARLVSVGLTNVPNFVLPALNREIPNLETDMDPAVLQALGLTATATAADAVLAINTLKSAEQLALNRAATPDPEKFVPRADHQLALDRITTFEAAEKTRADEAAVAAVDAAIAGGKIAPASRDYHLATCRADGGLERFTTFAAAQPVIVPASGLGKKDPVALPGKLNADELAVCRQLGMTLDDFAAARAAEGKE